MFLVCWIIKLLSVAYNLEKPVVIQQESIQLMEKCSSIDTWNCLEFYTHPVDSSVSICIIKTQETCTN